jgi:hypothetical protein
MCGQNRQQGCVAGGKPGRGIVASLSVEGPVGLGIWFLMLLEVVKQRIDEEVLLFYWKISDSFLSDWLEREALKAEKISYFSRYKYEMLMKLESLGVKKRQIEDSIWI